MPSFIRVTAGNMPNWYVNLDLVRAIQPANAGCIIHFDGAHQLQLSAQPDAIMQVIDQKGTK